MKLAFRNHADPPSLDRAAMAGPAERWPAVDLVSGLGNAAYFWHDLEKRAAAYSRDGRPFAMVLAQSIGAPDGFTRMARIVKQVSRLEDSVCDLGDGYLGVLVTGAGEVQGRQFVDRVSDASDWQPGDHRTDEAPGFGVAAWNERDVTDASSLAAAAEQDLAAYLRAALSQRRAWGSRE